jgi:hypothetical protein
LGCINPPPPTHTHTHTLVLSHEGCNRNKLCKDDICTLFPLTMQHHPNSSLFNQIFPDEITDNSHSRAWLSCLCLAPKSFQSSGRVRFRGPSSTYRPVYGSRGLSVMHRKEQLNCFFVILPPTPGINTFRSTHPE